jgi:hypothetical protein
MKELWKAIYDRLSSDEALLALLGGEARIGQAQQAGARALPCVVYDLWSARYEPVDQASGNRDPQHLAVRFSVFAADDSSAAYSGSTLCAEIAERLKALLHGADLGADDLCCYAALWDDFETAAIYDDAAAQWRCDLRFRFVVKALAPT